MSREERKSGLNYSSLGKSFMEYLDCAILLLDEKGTFVELNDRAAALMGVSKADFLKLELSILKTKRYPEVIREAFLKRERVTLNFKMNIPSLFSNAVLFEDDYLSVEGLPIDDAEKSGPVYLFMVKKLKDLAHGEQSESLFLGPETDYKYLHTRTLLSSLDKSVVFLNRDLEVVDMNRSFEEVFNCLRQATFFNKTRINTLSMFTTEMIQAAYDKKFHSESFYYALDDKLSCSGEVIQDLMENTRFFEYKGVPIFKKDVFWGYLCLFRDRTSERMILNELILAKKKVEASNKMKDVFLASMSHEMRTPLNSVIGFSDLMAEMLPENEETTMYHEMVKTNGDLLLRLIDDVLDFSKLEVGTMQLYKEDFFLSEVMEECVSQMRVKAEVAGVRLDLANYYHKQVFLDRKRVAQVLQNLLSNAVKFSASGDTVVLRAMEDGFGVRIEVEDKGVGIAETDRAKVFQEFEKVNSFTQGAGLGLTISKHIVELQGGRIDFTSLPNAGTTFWVWFPNTSVSS